jgi:hypothetical protein
MELNLSDYDFYKYIGVPSDSSTEMINKKLKQFYLKIHPDKCNLDNLREIFVDNSQILNLINSVSTNPADKNSDRQSICTKLYQLFSNKWGSLANSGEEISDEESVVDNQFTETFNNSLNAQFALQLLDFNTLNFYDAIINYIEANPSVTLSQDEINQIMYLLQKFVYDNKDNLFLFHDYHLPQQPLVQKGGSLNILLITLIFIFISSLFLSVQGQFATPNGLVSISSQSVSTDSTSQSNHDKGKQYLETPTIGHIFKEGQSILDVVSNLSQEVLTPTRSLVTKITGSAFDVIGKQVDSYIYTLDIDNFDLLESLNRKIQQKKDYEDKLKDVNTQNRGDLLANILALSNEIKEDSIKYSQSVLFKSVINTLLKERVTIPAEKQSVLFSTVKTLSSYSSDEAVLLVDDIEQIFYKFFSDLHASGVMKIPEKTTGILVYDNYIRQFIPSVTTFFKQVDELLENIDVSEEQARWEKKFKANTVGEESKASLQVSTENKLNSLIENTWIPALGTTVANLAGLHPAVSVSIGAVSTAYSIVNKVDSARLLWGHRLYLAKTTIKSAIPLLEFLKNMRVEGSYEQKTVKFTSEFGDKLLKRDFTGLIPIIGSMTLSAIVEWLYPTTIAKIKSSMQTVYVNNFGSFVQNPVCKDLINSGKLKLNNGNVSLEDLISSTAGFNFDTYSPRETNNFFDFILQNMNETYDPTISTYKSALGFTNSLSEALGLKNSKINFNNLLINIGTKLIQGAIKDNASFQVVGVNDTPTLFLPDIKPLGNSLGNSLRESIIEYNNSEGTLNGGIRYKKYKNTKNTKNKYNTKNTKNKYNKTKKIKKMPKTNSKKTKKNLKKSKK